MADYIIKTKAPSLAVAPNIYSQPHFDVYSNQLRIYFNAIDNANTQTIQEDNKLNTLIWLGL